MQVFLSALPALLLALQSASFKLYNKKSTMQNNEYLYNALGFLLCFVFIAPIAFIGQAFDVKSVFLGVPNGVAFAMLLVFYSKSMVEGKISFNNFILTMGMVIPIFYSVAIGEAITTFQIVGLVVFAVACYFMCYGQSAKGEKKPSRESYTYIIIATVANGMMAVLIKWSSNYYVDINQYQQLFGTFVTASLLLFASLPITCKEGVKAYISNKWFIICVVLCGISTLVGNIAFNLISVRIDGALYYPVENGVSMLMGIIIALIFREKITVKTVIGICFGVVAVVLLNL